MDIPALLKLGEAYGPAFLIFVVLLFVIWLQHKSHQSQLAAMSEREKRNYEQNQSMLEVLQQLVAQQSRIETKIDSNKWCPIVKKEAGQ